MEKNEKILAKGKLEHVVDSESKKEIFRIVIGSIEGKGNEYIKLIN